jgi:hypothetical protein
MRGRDIATVCEVGLSVSERLAHAPCLWLACAPARILFHGRYVARCVSRETRRPRQPNQHIFWLHLVTPTHWHASLAGRIPGIQGRVIIIMGRAVHAPGMALHAHANCAQRLYNRGARCDFGACVAVIAQVTNGIAPLHFRAEHEAKATGASTAPL